MNLPRDVWSVLGLQLNNLKDLLRFARINHKIRQLVRNSPFFIQWERLYFGANDMRRQSIMKDFAMKNDIAGRDFKMSWKGDILVTFEVQLSKTLVEKEFRRVFPHARLEVHFYDEEFLLGSELEDTYENRVNLFRICMVYANPVCEPFQFAKPEELFLLHAMAFYDFIRIDLPKIDSFVEIMSFEDYFSSLAIILSRPAYTNLLRKIPNLIFIIANDKTVTIKLKISQIEALFDFIIESDEFHVNVCQKCGESVASHICQICQTTYCKKCC